jgi:IS4 transposase
MFSITTFQQLMKGVPRAAFDQVVARHKAAKYCKHFKPWNHMTAMVYAQVSGAPSLRALESGFNAHASHHYHLGTSMLKRSTLSDANDKRSDVVFSEIAKMLMQQVSRKLRRQSEDLMYLLDSTSFTLKGQGFDNWTMSTRTRNTQGIKMHVLYEAKSEVPVQFDFSAANVNDIERAWSMPLEAGALYVFDKGYNDYNWWHKIDKAKALFVTRFKYNASLKALKQLDIPERAADLVLSDEIVEFRVKYPSGKRVNQYYGQPLRRVTVRRPGKTTPLVLATNDFTSSALEIAQRYKERWGIELFFKWIKQHLKIKQFLGRSENAVRIQILTALISYLLVALLHHSKQLTTSLWDFLCLIRATLFQRPEAEAAAVRRRREIHLVTENQGRLFQ